MDFLKIIIILGSISIAVGVYFIIQIKIQEKEEKLKALNP